MDRFTADSDIFVMVLSTLSGDVGFSLTEADTVISHDSDWNATVNTWLRIDVT